MKKRGVVLSIEIVLVIILSISVLVLLVYFLNQQTGFFSKYLDSQRGKSNIDEVINNCNSIATVESYYAYCCETREIIISKKENFEMNCNELREEEFVSGRIKLLDCQDIKCINE